ncbi:MAG: hypothetical protein JNM89_05755 [Hyphomicrobiaceae bacterium]|nr:hypothetical protein [Hyphomicrobiaceae bacterium]
MAFAQIPVWNEVGDFLVQAGLAASTAATALVHGVVGGAMSMVQGGSFLQGFAANAIGAFGADIAGGVTSDIAPHTAIVAAAGCAAAAATGGKCAEGATTAAFANLFNHFQHKGKDYVNPWDVGNDAHITLQTAAYAEDSDNIFYEKYSDGDGTYFLGRVDLGHRKLGQIWEIKPDSGYWIAEGLKDIAMYAVGSGFEYMPGGPSVVPSGPLKGQFGYYTYRLAARGVIVYQATPHAWVESYSFSTYWNAFYQFGPGNIAPYLLPTPLPKPKVN